LTAFILVLASCFAFVVLVFSSLSYAFFWFEAANSRHLDRLRDLSKGRIGRMMARGILASSLSLAFVLLTYPLGFSRSVRYSKTDPPCPSPPVIFVHGLYHNAGAWILFRRWFRAEGFRNIHALNYSSWNCSFHEILEQLDRLARQVTELSPGRPPVFVGHSLGGLLIRAYVDDPNRRSPVAAVVTLGTPHQGSKLAVLGLGRLAQSLRYKGPLIAEIERLPASPGIPRLAVYSPLDNMVLPAEASLTDRLEWTLHETSPISHIAMLHHRPTAKLALEFIRNGSHGLAGLGK
jgi:pimeloyl-ACP methyl ester carboxylesterase